MTEAKPLTVSWSRLKAWEECRQKAHLISIGKKSPATDIRVFFHGTVVDRVMRAWLQDPNREPGGMVGLIEQYMDSCERSAKESGDGVVHWRSTTDRRELTAWCKQLVVKLEPLLEELILPYTFEVAKRFRVPLAVPNLEGELQEIFLIGEMDLLAHETEIRKGLYDLKATANESYWKKTIAQLVFYDVVIELLYGEPAYRAELIQPMCEDTTVVATITQNHRDVLTGKIISYAQSVWRQDFDPKASSAGCSYCETRHACVKFLPQPGTRRVSFNRGAA